MFSEYIAAALERAEYEVIDNPVQSRITPIPWEAWRRSLLW